MTQYYLRTPHGVEVSINAREEYCNDENYWQRAVHSAAQYIDLYYCLQEAAWRQCHSCRYSKDHGNICTAPKHDCRVQKWRDALKAVFKSESVFPSFDNRIKD